jgi:hypothetical protein
MPRSSAGCRSMPNPGGATCWRGVRPGEGLRLAVVEDRQAGGIALT